MKNWPKLEKDLKEAIKSHSGKTDDAVFFQLERLRTYLGIILFRKPHFLCLWKNWQDLNDVYHEFIVSIQKACKRRGQRQLNIARFGEKYNNNINRVFWKLFAEGDKEKHLLAFQQRLMHSGAHRAGGKTVLFAAGKGFTTIGEVEDEKEKSKLRIGRPKKRDKGYLPPEYRPASEYSMTLRSLMKGQNRRDDLIYLFGYAVFSSEEKKEKGRKNLEGLRENLLDSLAEWIFAANSRKAEIFN